MLTYADASQVDVMIMLATDRNVEQVLMELKEYAYAEVLHLLLYLFFYLRLYLLLYKCSWSSRSMRMPRCLLYLCRHATIYVSSCYYVGPHTTIYVSSYYYICALILLYMCPHTTIYI